MVDRLKCNGPCGKLRDIKYFHRILKSDTKLRSKCKDCVNSATRNYRKSKNYRLWKMKYNAEHREYFQQKGLEWRNTFNGKMICLATSAAKYDRRKFGKVEVVTADDLIKLSQQQNGKCYFTNIEYTFTGSGKYKMHPTDVSLERIDNNKPHTIDNVVLVCVFFNIARNEWDLKDVVPLWNKLPKKIK